LAKIRNLFILLQKTQEDEEHAGTFSKRKRRFGKSPVLLGNKGKTGKVSKLQTGKRKPFVFLQNKAEKTAWLFRHILINKDIG
jgi:hypothetical protein